MTDAASPGDQTLFPQPSGERLKAAREAQGLSLAEIAARTRIPLRHLEAIELNDYSGLPSPTYSIGFAKAYARTVGLDEVAIGNEVREQAAASARPPTDYESYETADPKRTPSRGLAIGAALLALLILIGVGLYYGTGLFRGDGGAPAPIADSAPAPGVAPPTAPAIPAGGGQVTITATDRIWMRVYDAAGKVLFEKVMASGDSYDVPSNADKPMINVGDPTKIKVTLNGSALPALGPAGRPVRDVGVSADALRAVPTPAASPDNPGGGR